MKTHNIKKGLYYGLSVMSQTIIQIGNSLTKFDEYTKKTTITDRETFFNIYNSDR